METPGSIFKGFQVHSWQKLGQNIYSEMKRRCFIPISLYFRCKGNVIAIK